MSTVHHCLPHDLCWVWHVICFLALRCVFFLLPRTGLLSLCLPLRGAPLWFLLACLCTVVVDVQSTLS